MAKQIQVVNYEGRFAIHISCDNESVRWSERFLRLMNAYDHYLHFMPEFRRYAAAREVAEALKETQLLEQGDGTSVIALSRHPLAVLKAFINAEWLLEKDGRPDELEAFAESLIEALLASASGEEELAKALAAFEEIGSYYRQAAPNSSLASLVAVRGHTIEELSTIVQSADRWIALVIQHGSALPIINQEVACPHF